MYQKLWRILLRRYKEKEKIIKYRKNRFCKRFRDFGVEIEHVDIYCLDRGHIDIEMLIPVASNEKHGECEKLVAPMLSDILKENIVVKHEEKIFLSERPQFFVVISFGSAKTYSLDTGLATAAKGGGFVSGDSYAMMDLSVGKYALAISDGMGNGQRAHMESKETVKLLQKILQSGIDEEIAIKSINSILSLRTQKRCLRH